MAGAALRTRPARILGSLLPTLSGAQPAVTVTTRKGGELILARMEKVEECVQRQSRIDDLGRGRLQILLEELHLDSGWLVLN